MITQRDYYTVDLSGGGTYTANIIEARPRNGKTAVLLDRTPFYPEGGGQSADRGTISAGGVCAVVENVIEEGEEILHITDGALKPGKAELVLDMKRRRDFTVQHTAQHLLSGTILRLTGFPTVSMHLGEEFNTIDVNGKDIDAAALLAVEEEVADAIEKDEPVVIHLCPPENVEDFPLRKIPPKGEEVIRVVEIKNRDFSPCCGTHLKSAGLIGMLRILGAEKYKGMTRVSFIAGRRCLADSRMLRENAAVISKALSVPVEETGRGVLAFIEKTEQLEARLKEHEEAAAKKEAEAVVAQARAEGNPLESPADSCGMFFAEASMEEVLRIGKQIQKISPALFVLGSGPDLKFAALCSAKGADIRERVKSALEKTEGKGGGGPGFFQGVFGRAAELQAFVKGFNG